MSFHLKSLASLPADTDTIEVRNPNTAVKITGQLVDRTGANLANPFVVSAAGGGADMVFSAPAGVPYDVYWVEGSNVIGRVQVEPTFSMGGMSETATAKILTDTERIEISTIKKQANAAAIALGG